MEEIIPLLPLPTLSPRNVLPRRNAADFPLNQPDLYTTYLGRNAVWRAMLELGLSHQEMIVPSYHHGVEVEAIVRAHVKPVFARVDEKGVLDLQHVESLITPKTKALYVIHYAGFPQPVEAILALTRKYGLLLVEDCALSLFSSDGGTPLGSHADAAIFCFYKTLPVPHGGALLLKNKLPKNRMKDSPGWVPTLSLLAGSTLLHLERKHPAFGVPFRRTLRQFTVSARQKAFNEVVPVGTQELDENALQLGMNPFAEWILHASNGAQIVRQRRANFAWLHQAIGHPEATLWDQLPDGMCPLFYPLRVQNKESALAQFHADGIMAIDFWRYGHASCPTNEFPDVERLRSEIVELPIHQDLSEADLNRIAVSARAVHQKSK